MVEYKDSTVKYIINIRVKYENMLNNSIGYVKNICKWEENSSLVRINICCIGIGKQSHRNHVLFRSFATSSNFHYCVTYSNFYHVTLQDEGACSG